MIEELYTNFKDNIPTKTWWLKMPQVLLQPRNISGFESVLLKMIQSFILAAK